MGLSARTPTTATRATYYFIPAIYTNRVIEAVKNELVCWDCVDSSWGTEFKKGDIVYFAKTNTVTATEVVVGTKGTAKNPFNTAGGSITIDQWYESPIDIDTMTNRQTHIQMEDYAVGEARYSIAKVMDTYINGLFSTLNSSSVLGTDGVAMDDDLVLNIKETLDEADVPAKPRFMIGDPSTLIDMLKIDKLLSAQYGSIGAVANGIIGNSVYGFQFRVTNNLTAATTGAYGAMLHPKAIGAAAQMENAWREEYKELHQIRYSVESLWGAGLVNGTFGIPFYTRKA